MITYHEIAILVTYLPVAFLLAWVGFQIYNLMRKDK
jgi:hypothetical protein